MPTVSARVALVAVGLAGELLGGGLLFGWNALSLVLKDLGVYGDGCDGDVCPSQAAALAVVWTSGSVAVNFGPALAGVALDRLGPRATAASGATLCAAGLLLFGVLVPHFERALPAAIALIGMGGVAYHVAQFNVAQLFPTHQGLLAALYVGAFVASTVTFQVQRVVFEALGANLRAFRLGLAAHGCAVLLFAPLMLWMLPRRAVQPGQRYRFCARRLAFECSHALDSGSARQHTLQCDVTITDGQAAPLLLPGTGSDGSVGGRAGDGTSQKHVGRQDAGAAQRDVVEPDELLTHTTVRNQCDLGPGARPRGARWAHLAQQPLASQVRSPEFRGICTFFALNMFTLHFYFGTARLQLEAKGDADDVYTTLLGYVAPSSCVCFLLTGYLLDRLGFSCTAAVDNCLFVVSCLLEMVPSLPVQVATFCTISLARYLLYSTYFAITAAVFGHETFGHIVGMQSVVFGGVGLLQVPVTMLTLGFLRGQFVAIQTICLVCVLMNFTLAWAMHVWERSNVLQDVH